MIKKQSKGMKRLATIILAMALVLTSITPAFAKEDVKQPALNATKKTIVVGKTFNFNVKNQVKDSTYAWSSNNEQVATVNKDNGVVTGVAKGLATITCRIKLSDKYVRLTAKVTVLKPAIKVTIKNPIETINVGKSYNLNIDILPLSSTDEVTWTSSDKEIANPSYNGFFKALKTGTVTITCTSVSGRSDSVTIKVIDATSDVVAETPATETPSTETKIEGGKINE